jgi:hypothetical protein
MTVLIKRTVHVEKRRFLSVFAINDCICQNAVFEFVRSCGNTVCRSIPLSCFEGNCRLNFQGHVYSCGCGHVTQACCHQGFHSHPQEGKKIPRIVGFRWRPTSEMFISDWLALNMEAACCIKTYFKFVHPLEFLINSYVSTSRHN